MCVCIVLSVVQACLWYTCVLLVVGPPTTCLPVQPLLPVFPCSGPSLLLVLSRYEAIQGWRGMMGAVDPAEAKEEDPNWWEGEGDRVGVMGMGK